MKMKHLLIFFLSSSIFLTSFSFAESNQTLRFATEATYPPFEYIDASGQIKGFDIDIINALCQQMKAQCTFSNQSFNSLIPSLQLGKFDALIAALGVTTERQKQVDFTDSYYEPSASFVAPIAKNYTLADIKGKIIGVQQGSTLEKYLHDTYRDTITIKTYASIQDAFLDLQSDRVDVVLTDTPMARVWLKNENTKIYQIVDKPIIDHQYFGVGYSIAVKKNNQELMNDFNKALAQIKANGTYDKIMKAYFS